MLVAIIEALFAMHDNALTHGLSYEGRRKAWLRACRRVARTYQDKKGRNHLVTGVSVSGAWVPLSALLRGGGLPSGRAGGAAPGINAMLMLSALKCWTASWIAQALVLHLLQMQKQGHARFRDSGTHLMDRSITRTSMKPSKQRRLCHKQAGRLCRS